MKRVGMLVVISGPSGVGKTTIAHRVESDLGAMFSVSMTTRRKTDKDREGIDYCFVNVAQFERRRDAGELLEWAEVFGNHYGTPRQPVIAALDRGKLMILEIDVEGAIQVKHHMPDAFAIFIDPPSEETLLERLRGRCRDSEEVIQERFMQAKNETERARTCEVYDHFIVNADLSETVRETEALIKQELDRRATCSAS